MYVGSEEVDTYIDTHTDTSTVMVKLGVAVGGNLSSLFASHIPREQ